MEILKCFTIESGKVKPGVIPEKFTLSAGVEIYAILVGEEGRGRKLGILPTDGVQDRRTILHARIGESRSGKPKLVAADAPTTSESAIVHFRTDIGFRGGNSHTGERCGGKPGGSLEFAAFPGKIIAEGRVAQGTAGRMGGGTQMVAVMPRGVVFRTGYHGRLYGAPSAHYYLFDGEKIHVATWDERGLLPDDHPLAIRKTKEPADEPAVTEHIVNLTPHALNIQREDGTMLEIPPSGTVARVTETREARSSVAGIAVTAAVYGEVENLPEPQTGTIYVVSALVLQRTTNRPDVFAPGPALRDEAGKIIGCVGLSAGQ